MITNIFFIHSFPFTKEAFIRDEFEYFISLGYNVQYLDIAELIKKCHFEKNYSVFLSKYVVPFSTKKEFKYYLSKFQDSAIIITDVGLLAKTAWMYNAIFSAKLPYILFENSTLQLRNKKNTRQQTKIKFVKFISRLNSNKFVSKPLQIIQYSIAGKLKYSPEIILTYKKKLGAEMRALRFKETTVKMNTNTDYNVAQNIQETPRIESPYAVFVDQYFIHHPDFKSNHIIHNFTAQQYYEELNKYLKSYSEHTTLKIAIAAHPRRAKTKRFDFLPEFDLYYNKTAELIKHSEVVLLHFSTALNFAVIFKKPFIILDSELFYDSNIKLEIDVIAKRFEQKPRLMSDLKVAADLPTVNTTIYQSFFQKFIKHPDADERSFKEHIINTLEDLQTKTP